jgi:hypothetical protein
MENDHKNVGRSYVYVCMREITVIEKSIFMQSGEQLQEFSFRDLFDCNFDSIDQQTDFLHTVITQASILSPASDKC